MKRRVFIILLLLSVVIGLAWYIDQRSYAGDAFRADLRGKVVDARGRPVEGIEVVYVRYYGTGVLAKTVTRRDGSFTFPSFDASPLFPGDPGCFVASRKAKYIGWKIGPEWDDELPVSIGNRSFDITVSQPVTEKTLVVDTHGRPVAGLAVSVHSIYKGHEYIGLNVIQPFITPVAHATDAAGRITVAGVAGGCRIDYDVNASGFARVDELSREGRIVVARTGRIAGRVCLEDGTPVSGIEVSCESSKTMTGNDGSYELEVLPGTHDVSVSNDYFGRKPFYDVAVKSEHTTHRDLVIHGLSSLPPKRPKGSVTLSGVVVDEITRKPVPWVAFFTMTTVWSTPDFYNDHEFDNSEVKTDSRGRFRTVVSPGMIDIMCVTTRNPYYSSIEGRDIEAKKKSVTGITLYARRAHLVRGCVRDDKAKPVAGATVSASNRRAVTDHEGSFVLAAHRYDKQEGWFSSIGKAISSTPEQNERHREYVLAVNECRKLGGYKPFDHGLPGSGLSIVVKPEVDLAVQVRDSSGRAVKNATARCVPDPSWFGGLEKPTNTKGEVKLGPLCAGVSYKLVCSAEGYDDIVLDMPVAGSKNWRARKQVTLKPASRAITGVVLDKAGNPVVGAEIRTGSCERALTTTGAGGSFLFKTGERNAIYIRAAKGDIYGESCIRAAQNDVVVRLGTRL